MKTIIRYLKATKTIRIIYDSNKKRNLTIKNYFNSNRVRDYAIKKSTSGFIFILNGGLVSGYLKK